MTKKNIGAESRQSATALKLKPLSQSELRDYIAHVLFISPQCPWGIDQAQMVGQSLSDNDEFVKFIHLVLLEDIDPRDMLITVIVQGFMMGREFEVLAMQRAFRRGVV